MRATRVTPSIAVEIQTEIDLQRLRLTPNWVARAMTSE
jgi:hypothetical protein